MECTMKTSSTGTAMDIPAAGLGGAYFPKTSQDSGPVACVGGVMKKVTCTESTAVSVAYSCIYLGNMEGELTTFAIPPAAKCAGNKDYSTAENGGCTIGDVTGGDCGNCKAAGAPGKSLVVVAVIALLAMLL